MSKRKNTAEKHKKKAERQRKIRNTRLAVIISAIAVSLIVASVVLIVKLPREVDFKADGSGFRDTKSKITYLEATPTVYEPRLILSNGYGEYGKMDGDSVYRIDGADPKQWLARVRFEELVTVYYAEGVNLPSLEEFGAIRFTLYDEGGIIVEALKVTESDTVDAVVEEFVGALEVNKPDNVTKTYNIRFESEKYPFLYYCVKFVRTADGDYYCDHADGSYYPASSLIGDALDGE